MRLFFHAWRDDRRLADETGLEVADLGQARILAARALGEMARDALYSAVDPLVIGIDIAADDETILTRLRLAFTADPEV